MKRRLETRLAAFARRSPQRTGRLRRAAAALALAAGMSLPLTEASATWSIILIDTRTGEVAAGSATCLTGRDLQADTPVLIAGVGAATAQSFIDTTGQNRRFIADGLSRGLSLQEILDGLAVRDSGHQSRQYGIADVTGDTITFTGTGAGDWAGGEVGSFEYTHAGQTGTIVYAIQGNVLAGSPVVEQAVEAIMLTQGDLPTRLMAGMEAAHEFGGDGRCSCGGDADACGAPPPSFDPATDKSSHIGYMLIARAGDSNGCGIPHLFAQGLRFGRAVDAADLTGDGMPDAVVVADTSIFMAPNLSTPGAPFVALGDGVELVTTQPAGLDRPGNPSDLEVADVTGDGLPDAIIGLTGSTALDRVVTLHRGLPGGTFDLPEVIDQGGTPTELLIVDLNNDNLPDITWSSAVSEEVAVLLADGQGGFNALPRVPTPGGALGLDSFTDPDTGRTGVVLAQPASDRVAILTNDGTGALALTQTLEVGDNPRDVAVADFDNNGFDDIAAVNVDGLSATILLLDADGASRSDLALPGTPASIRAADINGDQFPDLITRGGLDVPNASLVNRGDGSFEPAETLAPVGGRRFAVADLNADGLDDVLTVTRDAQLVANTNNGDVFGPRYSLPGGCASGDYFMEFNVAFTQSSDPDPTLTLRDMFDDWRAGLVGRPDAVVSAAVLDADRLVGDGTSQTSITVSLRDFDQSPITTPVQLDVTHAPGSAGVSIIGTPIDLGSGVFQVPITAGSGSGIDVFQIDADDGIGKVRLMPSPSVRIIASAADVNGDGVVDANDFFEYLSLFTADDDRADLTGPGGDGVPDGVLNAEDFFFYLSLFAGP